MKKKLGVKFLKQINPNLHTDHDFEAAKRVENRRRRMRNELKNGKEKFLNANQEEKIENYINLLSETFTEKDQKKKEIMVGKLKSRIYKKFCIKPFNVLENYFLTQQRLAEEQGNGIIEINEAEKEKMINILIENQKHSLDT